MAFVPYDFETATIVITNAAGIVTFNNGATAQQIETQDELPIRGGSLSSQVEAFLEARYGNFTFCDCGSHAPNYSGKLNKIELTFTPNTGVTRQFVRISVHALWPKELTSAVREQLAELQRTSAVRMVEDLDGLTLHLDVACQIFTGQNLELGLGELLTVRKQLKDTYKSKGKKQ